MTTSRNAGRNSSSLSGRTPHLQNVLSDTNEDEKAQSATLSIEALRTVGRIVQGIKARINAANGHDGLDSATCIPLDSVSGAAIGPMGREDHNGAKKEK